MKKSYTVSALLIAAFFAFSYCNPPAKASGRVFFTEPADGAVIEGKVKVMMGVEGMEVKPAGELVEGTGHHHIIINGSSVEKGMVVPADEKYIHFGKGQTETELELEPGEYSLTLQFANGLHESYGPDLSQTIKITVK
ncbi:MAG: DUF4399 domain-containing protein [Spirochaetia bacterium]|nr:DUF4399 domain-containing protein [Spirochaetia bacterium]